jgi:hypothetical protein
VLRLGDHGCTWVCKNAVKDTEALAETWRQVGRQVSETLYAHWRRSEEGERLVRNGCPFGIYQMLEAMGVAPTRLQIDAHDADT